MCRRYEICCCCGSIQTGSKIIICLDLIGAILSFFALIAYAVPGHGHWYWSLYWVACVVNLVWIGIDSLGLYGLFSKKPEYVLEWLIFEMIILVVSSNYTGRAGGTFLKPGIGDLLQILRKEIALLLNTYIKV